MASLAVKRNSPPSSLRYRGWPHKIAPSGEFHEVGRFTNALSCIYHSKALAFFHTDLGNVLAGSSSRRENPFMRALAAVLVACGVIFAVYHYYFHALPTTAPGTAPTQAISLTGVRGDLLQIAQAERAQVALHDHCISLDDLISSHALALSRPERDGYAFSLTCSGGDFTVTARHAPVTDGSLVRYPTLTIDQTMQVREAN